MESQRSYPVTKSSGEKQVFETGAQRDTQDKKPRFDFIPVQVLDAIQVALGGAPMAVDMSFGVNDYFTGYIHESECRYDLIPGIVTNRLAALYKRGADKYGENNYQKGIPLDRIYASLFRHLIYWAAGYTDEDHMAAILFNAGAIMYTEHFMDRDILPKSLATAGPLSNVFDNRQVP